MLCAYPVPLRPDPSERVDYRLWRYGSQRAYKVYPGTNHGSLSCIQSVARLCCLLLHASVVLRDNQPRRDLAFEDTSVLSRLTNLVTNATTLPTTSTNSDDTPQVSCRPSDQLQAVQSCQDFSGLGGTFHAPVQASPEATSALRRAFVVLRDSCAGCRHNQALIETALADAASKRRPVIQLPPALLLFFATPPYAKNWSCTFFWWNDHVQEVLRTLL